MKKLYGNLNMTWLKVILFAVAAGVYTGAVMLVPFFSGTSFQDIGISYEWWVIFAVIIVVNCKKSWEATLKCFAFFLVSQPLVYLVEIIFGGLALDSAMTYYFQIWLPMTFLTLPGGFIAYFCKKQNFLGAVVLGLGNTIQAVHVLIYFGKTIQNFPYHLLSGIVCVASIIIMSLYVQKEKKNRIIALIVPIVMTAAILILLKVTGRVLF